MFDVVNVKACIAAWLKSIAGQLLDYMLVHRAMGSASRLAGPYCDQQGNQQACLLINL